MERSLEILPEQNGSWEYSELFRDLSVAKEWQIDPLDFWSRSKLSRAFMIAHCEVSGTMQSFEMKQKKD